MEKKERQIKDLETELHVEVLAKEGLTADLEEKEKRVQYLESEVQRLQVQVKAKAGLVSSMYIYST